MYVELNAPLGPEGRAIDAPNSQYCTSHQHKLCVANKLIVWDHTDQVAVPVVS